MKAMLNESTDLLASIFKMEWNQLDVSIRSSQTISELKRKRIQLVRPKRQSYFGVGHDIEGIRRLTQLRVKFKDLREHRFRHIFELTSNDLCTLLLHGNEQFDTVTDRAITEVIVLFTQRFKRLKRN